MPPKTTITSERARELGRRGAAAVDRDPATGAFRRRNAAPAPEPDDPAPPPAPEPAPEPTPAPEPAPGFRMARRLFGRGRRS